MFPAIARRTVRQGRRRLSAAARNQRLAAGQPVAPLITVFAAVRLLFHFGLHTGRFLELFFKLAVKIRFLRINQFRFFIHGFFPLL